MIFQFKFEIIINDLNKYLISKKVFKIGNYFVKHLLETRHRGAFELAYVGFTNLCQTFWKLEYLY